MKKFAFLIMCSLFLVSCELEDDGPGIIQVYAEVVDADLPESFERGKVYEIDVTFLLPDACHSPQGIYATRGGTHGTARRDIYVAGIASHPATVDECTKPDTDLEREGSFPIRIDENEPFTFYLWAGVDDDDKSVYTKIIVPVVDPDSPTEEE